MPAARDLLDAINASGVVEAADGESLAAFPTSMPAADTAALERLVVERRALRTLETGMAYGLSTLAISAAHGRLGSGSHVAIDPYQDRFRRIGALNLERAGASARVRLVEQPSERALPRLWEEGLQLDLALLDGQHLFDHTLIDFFYADRMLVDGGVVVFHDIWMPAIRDVVAYVTAHRAYDRVEVGGGLSAVRKLRADDRRWDFHRPFARRLGARLRR